MTMATDSRSALLREFRAWRRLCIVKRDETFSLIFFSPKANIWSWSWRRRATRGPMRQGRAQGGAPHPHEQGVGPLAFIFGDNFSLFFLRCSVEFQVIPRIFIFCTKNNTMAILLKTASVRVSSIQIIQVRVQNKGKSVWKSRYDGDVSTPTSLNPCLSLSNSVDKLKERKTFTNSVCSCCCNYVKPSFKFSAQIITSHICNNSQVSQLLISIA